MAHEPLVNPRSACDQRNTGNAGVVPSDSVGSRVMDWVTISALATAGGDDMLCTMPAMSALSGMSAMYLLMSLFHLTPWLKRITHSRNHANKE